MTGTTQAATSIDARVAAVVTVAAAHAVQVDEAGELPTAAIESMRYERLLGPGPGLSPRTDTRDELWTAEQLSSIAARLGAACSSTGLIWAMHQGQLQSLARHCDGSPTIADYVAAAWDDQPLIASLLSERGGADPRVGNAFCQPVTEGRIRINKAASVASYLRAADAALVMARRSKEAPPTDQVLVLARADEIRYEVIAGWHALGMRGTGSDAADVVVDVPSGRILPDSFGVISAATMNPLTHLTWASCWFGIAHSAVALARRHLRTVSAQLSSDLTTARMIRLGELGRTLENLRAQLVAFAVEFDRRARADTEAPAPGNELTRTSNFLRLSAAELAVQAALGAFELVGVDAYRTGPTASFSLGRQLRDLLSALVMISGDRIRLADGLLSLFPGGRPL